MAIFTSSWFTPIQPNAMRIGVSRTSPRGIPAGYRMLKILAPGPWFRSVSPDEYRQRYFDEVLTGMSANWVVEIIDRMVTSAGKRDAVLCCFEKPEDAGGWCHRGYISAWLADQFGLVVPELTRPLDGTGWQHPKLPPEHRRQPQAPTSLPWGAH